MKITWKITKKRGNWRPVLEFECIKEDWEVELRIHLKEVQSIIPTPPRVYDKTVFEGEYEREKGWATKEYYLLYLPNPNELSYSKSLTLPWRPGAHPAYPEVAESMRMLLGAYEKALKEAYDSAPFEEAGSLEMSDDCKRHVAPGIAAKRLLKAVNE